MVWNISLVSWVTCPCSVPSHLLEHPQPPHWSSEKRKCSWLYASPAQQQPQHPWIINTVFGTNPKHSLTPATVKKIHSSPAKTSIPSSKGCGPRPAGVQEERDLPGITGYCIVLRNFHYVSFAYSVQTQWVQLILIHYQKLRASSRECVSAHLVGLMSGHIALAWDFNQSTGRILLKLPRS